MNSIHQLDELVKEYLLFRGFTNTFKAFETESRSDKDKGFQVEKILDELFNYIQTSDISSLIDYWRYLDLRYFARLDTRFQRTVKKFELCLLRYYLVYASQQKRKDKIVEFFEQFGPELHNNPEWSLWFALPYSKDPKVDPTFETFFSKGWLDNFTVSLHNFLSTVFQHMPLPNIFLFQTDRNNRLRLQSEVEALRQQIAILQQDIDQGESEITSLKQQVDSHNTKHRRRASALEVRTRGAGVNYKRFSLIENSERALGEALEEEMGFDSTKLDDQMVMMASPEILEGGYGSEIEHDHEIFSILSQEEFLEHTTSVVHAKFSSDGNMIASCDMENIVRIWSYSDDSNMSPCKISISDYNVLSMEWEARAEKILFLGTDNSKIRTYNTETKSFVQDFELNEKYPWVTQVSASPVEPVLVCAGSAKPLLNDNGILKNSGAGILEVFNIKSMSSAQVFTLDPDKYSPNINTVQFNHNGQMIVTGDDIGFIRIFDARVLQPIMEWKISSPNISLCSAQFSFDENSILAVENGGLFCQWSIHKPGMTIASHSLLNFPPPPAFQPSEPPKLQRTSSVSSTTSSLRKHPLPPLLSFDSTVTHSLLSVSPRSQSVAFSSDTDHLLCATSADGTPRAMVIETGTGKIVQTLKGGGGGGITAVNWTSGGVTNACLVGGVDGGICVSKLMKI